MKTQKIIKELNDLLDICTKEQKKYRKKSSYYLKQIKTEEQDIRKKLNKTNKKTSRRRLEKQLSLVKKGYDQIGLSAQLFT